MYFDLRFFGIESLPIASGAIEQQCRCLLAIKGFCLSSQPASLETATLSPDSSVQTVGRTRFCGGTEQRPLQSFPVL